MFNFLPMCKKCKILRTYFIPRNITQKCHLEFIFGCDFGHVVYLVWPFTAYR